MSAGGSWSLHSGEPLPSTGEHLCMKRRRIGRKVRKSRRVVSSSYLVIPHMHTSIHTYMHIISYLLAHTYYTHFSPPTKPTPQLPHTRVEKVWEQG